MPSGVPVGGDETGSAKVSDVHIADGLRELAGPDSNRQHFVDRYCRQTVHSGRSSPGVSSRLRQSHLGSRYRLPATLRPAHGPRTDTVGVLSCVAQLGAEVAQIDRSVVRANVAGVEERPCSGLARSVAVDRLTSPRASTAVMRRRQTQPGLGKSYAGRRAWVSVAQV
jgi:hypothetical protein